MFYLFILISIIFTSSSVFAKDKIIIDVDLHHYTDDHEALIMLANLHKQNKLELLGVTLVAGNQWIEQIEHDTLKAVERLQLADELHVYKGADRPLIHNQDAFEHAKNMYGLYNTGAWTVEQKITLPPDGDPEKKEIHSTHALDFIIDQVRKHPNQITIAALGPLTNIALAIRKAPDISAKIKRIIYMGGAFFVSGNVTGSAEFNWWFDAEAAAIVLNEEIEHIIVPLDATDQLLFDKNLYDKMIKKHEAHINIETYLKPKFSKIFNDNPLFKIPVWDALVSAYLYDPTIVETETELLVGVDYAKGPNYGRSFSYPMVFDDKTRFPVGTKPAKVLLKFDEERFWDIYENLMFYNNN